MLRTTKGQILLFLFILVPFLCHADGYQVRFRVNGLKDTTCMIATYYGNGTYIKDTLKVDHNGRFTYRPPQDIERGIYIVVINDKTYFEFILDRDTKFSMETDLSDLQGKMIVKDTPENSLFYEYLKYNRTMYGEIQKLQASEKKHKDNQDSLKLIGQKIDDLNSVMIKYKIDVAAKHPDSFVSFFINAMREPEIPEIPLLPNGKKDSTFAYRYYQSHYWDGTNFADDRLLHTPVFHNKLKKYFDKVVVQNPDSIIRQADILIEKTRPNPEMFKYLVWFITYTYENSEIMGFDKVFVHVVDRYYMTKEVTWVTPAVMDNIIKKAKRLKPLLLGEQAPNMIMMDSSGQLISMHNIKADFLILLFWDPDCSHCEVEIPKLKDFYEKQKDSLGLKIFAVCSDSSMAKWKSNIRKKKMDWINVNGPRTLTGDYHEQYDITTTPVIYLLDEKKIIIAKHLQPEQLLQFIRNFKRMKGRK
jgi:hypothetical protein